MLRYPLKQIQHSIVTMVTAAGEPESSVLQACQNELIAALEDRVQALRASPFLFVHVARDLNGEAHLLISG